MPQTRKLAAIMFTDIVGYTALMGNDEEKAFRILEQNRKIHKTLLQEFNGTWLKEIGDGVLASFNTITDAVLCAQQIREACEKEGQYSLRIGIHQGEVVFENDDVFGDGVNLASRIQAAAPPGGIYLSDSVARNFNNKKGLVISYAGEKNLKNVSYPVIVYELLKEGQTAVAKPINDGLPEKRFATVFSKRKWIVYPALSIVLLIAAYFIVKEYSSSNIIAGEKTIAILPFKNLNPDNETSFFVTGIHEDVINRLASLKDLKVISRTSVLRIKDSTLDLPAIGRKLDAAYIVEGSVSRMGNQVKINVQLFDAKTDKSLWSESYEKEMSNVFALQSEIALEISNKLNAKISSKERKELNKIPTDDLAAYDDFIRARSILNSSQLNYEKIMQAITFLESATGKDKNFAEAWGLLSVAQSRRYDKVKSFDDREEEKKLAAEAAAKALEKIKSLDPESATAFRTEGYYFEMVKGDDIKAISNYDKALAASPNDAKTLFLMTNIVFRMGNLDRLIENLEKVFEIDKGNAAVIYGLTFGYELKRDFKKMVPFLEKLVKLEPEKTHYEVQAKYYRFLSEGSLESFKAFESAVKTVRKTDVYDERAVENNEMTVAMVNDEFDKYVKAWKGKWDSHYAGHGNWSCPLIINEDLNHAHYLMDHGYKKEADEILAEAKKAIHRPVNEMSVCIFDKDVYQPKLFQMTGDTTAARKLFEENIVKVLKNNRFPRGAVEKSVLLQSADMVAPDKIYSIYKEIADDPGAFICLEVVCANPWTYPNLLKDPQFISDVRKDGRFVKFLEHYGLLKKT